MGRKGCRKRFNRSKVVFVKSYPLDEIYYCIVAVNYDGSIAGTVWMYEEGENVEITKDLEHAIKERDKKNQMIGTQITRYHHYDVKAVTLREWQHYCETDIPFWK